MLLEEFERLTNIYPTPDLYTAIESAYTEFDGDKKAFCKAYQKNEDGIAERVQRRATRAHFGAVHAYANDIACRNTEIENLRQEMERLKAELEKEQEWKPYKDTENVQ